MVGDSYNFPIEPHRSRPGVISLWGTTASVISPLALGAQYR
jgi:hypothetical protein